MVDVLEVEQPIRLAADAVAPVGVLCHRLVNEDLAQLLQTTLLLNQRAATNRAYGVILDVTGVRIHEQPTHVVGSLQRSLARQDRWLYLIVGEDGPNKGLLSGVKGVSHHVDLASARKASETYKNMEESPH